MPLLACELVVDVDSRCPCRIMRDISSYCHQPKGKASKPVTLTMTGDTQAPCRDSQGFQRPSYRNQRDISCDWLLRTVRLRRPSILQVRCSTTTSPLSSGRVRSFPSIEQLKVLQIPPVLALPCCPRPYIWCHQDALEVPPQDTLPSRDCWCSCFPHHPP
jgi:hypothetical protein